MKKRIVCCWFWNVAQEYLVFGMQPDENALALLLDDE